MKTIQRKRALEIIQAIESGKTTRKEIYSTVGVICGRTIKALIEEDLIEVTKTGYSVKCKREKLTTKEICKKYDVKALDAKTFEQIEIDGYAKQKDTVFPFGNVYVKYQ